MVLVNIPNIETHNDKELFEIPFLPLSVFCGKKAVITKSWEDSILEAFAWHGARFFNPAMRSRFVLQILYRTSSFLTVLKKYWPPEWNCGKQAAQVHTEPGVNRGFETGKESGLLYDNTPLNEVVLEKLFKKNDNIKKYQEDEELLEDVIVENKQAIEMANIYSGILSGMMDALHQLFPTIWMW